MSFKPENTGEEQPERAINLLTVGWFFSIRLIVVYAITMGIYNVLTIVNPLYKFSFGITDGVSEIGIGLFLLLVLINPTAEH